MKHSTEQSNQSQAKRAAAGNSRHRPSSHPSTARHGAHSMVQRQIEASALYQYRLPRDGRKWRVQCMRRQRLAIYLAGYTACYPGLKRIARDLGWSRRTVAVVMAQLKRLGVMVPQGYVAEHGTRLRALKPEALHSRFRESCTPASRESCTQELPKKNHKSAAGAATSRYPRVFATKTEKPRTNLGKRLSRKLKGKTLKDQLTGLSANQLVGMERYYGQALKAIKALKYNVDLTSPLLGTAFLGNLSFVWERFKDAGLPASTICSKVIDWCQLGHDYWPPDFQAHRDRLVSEEAAQRESRKERHPKAWEEIGIEPCGILNFVLAWEEIWGDSREGELFSVVMERCIQRCQAEKIQVPRPFYDRKHWIENHEETAEVARVARPRGIPEELMR